MIMVLEGGGWRRPAAAGTLWVSMPGLTVHAITRGLQDTCPDVIPDTRVRWRAAVAVVLRDLGHGPEVLVIRRAVREGDRWSGDAALPGGKSDPQDASLVDTAAREALEEVGLDLSSAKVLGRLSDHPRGSFRRWTRWSVTPVLFEIHSDPALVLDTREVAEALWVPLAALTDGQHEGRRFHYWRPVWKFPLGVPMVVPRWIYDGLSIWGLTRAILEELLRVAGT